MTTSESGSLIRIHEGNEGEKGVFELIFLNYLIGIFEENLKKIIRFRLLFQFIQNLLYVDLQYSKNDNYFLNYICFFPFCK